MTHTIIVGTRGPVAMEIKADSYRVMVKGRSGADLRIGTVSRATSYASGERVEGWRYMPMTQASPSRRVWPTAEAALKGRVKDYALVAIWPESSANSGEKS